MKFFGGEEMKKLGKKRLAEKMTVEAFACTCTCGCPKVKKCPTHPSAKHAYMEATRSGISTQLSGDLAAGGY